jgi:hypothetical protein
MVQEFASLDVRPYQLLHIVSKVGEGHREDLGDPDLNAIWRAIRENPAQPLTLRCNVTSTYAYQNPGPAGDTPEGELFNVRRDLKILQRMGLVPGATRPAYDLFERLLERIETVEGIAWFAEATSEAWEGEPQPSDHYEVGRALGLAAILGARAAEEMARVKEGSVRAMYDAEVLEIRPHHMMCMTCYYGRRPGLTPIDEDNIFEAIAIMHQDPEIPIRLIAGPCMICPPCHHYRPSSGLCVGGCSMSLRDELKDLDVLQRLGLVYGDELPAREVFTLLYDRITSTHEVCAHEDGIERSPEWRICGGAEGNPHYAVGRAMGLGFLEPRPEWEASF